MLDLFASLNRPDEPGASVMVIHRGESIVEQGFGLSNLKPRTACNVHTNFRLASVSKQFTALAILMLVERKSLSLNERLPDIFPEFPPYGRRVTVQHLLTHTSGLLDYEQLIPRGTTIPVSDKDVLTLLTEAKRTYFPPGTRYRYSNSGYALLALTVETRAGRTFAHFLKQNIFQPLRMENSLAYQAGLSLVPNRAYGYSEIKKKRFIQTDQNLTSSVLGDGGIYSSVADLFKWDQALYTDQLLSRKRMRLAFKSWTATNHRATGYGYGWYIGSYRGFKEVWHSGESIGFTTRIVRFPQKQFTVIILGNRNAAQFDHLPHRVFDYLFS